MTIKLKLENLGINKVIDYLTDNFIDDITFIAEIKQFVKKSEPLIVTHYGEAVSGSLFLKLNSILSSTKEN